MPIIHFEVNMVTVVFALCVIIFLGRGILRGLPALSMPRIHLPAIRLRIAIPKSVGFRRDPAGETVHQSTQRTRQLAPSRHDGANAEQPVAGPESLLEETMRCLEQAFDSFEAGRICADTYRSMLLAERRAAVRRRVRLAATDGLSGPDAKIANGELSEADAAVEAVGWCLNWLDDFERSPEPSALSNPGHSVLD